MAEKGQKELFSDYMERFNERAKKVRIHSPHQMAGLDIASILGDEKNKSLYMRMAKTYGAERMMATAKSVAENNKVNNKGAYFMSVVKEENKKAKNERVKDNNNK